MCEAKSKQAIRNKYGIKQFKCNYFKFERDV